MPDDIQVLSNLLLIAIFLAGFLVGSVVSMIMFDCFSRRRKDDTDTEF